MYPKTEPKPNFTKIEHEVLDFWRTDDTFHKALSRGGEPFAFYDGPPFANGLPHWGHLGVSAVKDMVCRYQTMRGRKVERELGWDCHGLPAENSVERREGAPAKTIVEKSGMGAFCEMCRADVQTYAGEWKTFIERIGRWVDMGDDVGYRTMDMKYMECVIGTLAKLYEKGLLYKDYRVNPFDWKMGTVLSNSAASQDYQDVVDAAVTVWFGLEDGRRVLAWTTTPWTLPANSALAVNPNVTYVEMKDRDGAVYIIGKKCLAAYEKQFAESVPVREIKGSELSGLSYEPLFDYYKGRGLHKIISADYVSDSDGTGIVHITPAFGEDDFWSFKSAMPGAPVVVNVDANGNFDESVRDFAGQNIFAATPAILEYLKKRGVLVKKEQYRHSYPFSYRSHEKLICRATDSWYIDVPKIREKLIANNAKVRWTSAGGRFADWIANARPWSVSRNRFWGTPLPIWTRDREAAAGKSQGNAGDNVEYKIFGSVAEIEDFFGVKLTDLHRESLDRLEKDGWKRIPDVLDCWVESGSMPWASIGFNPWTEAEGGLPANFPADYIIEGQDQTRGWFYSLMVLATALFDMPAFRVVSVNGMIVDENKKKFSKSLRNFANPEGQLEQFGADAMRLFILGSNFMKAEPVPVDKEGRVFAESAKTILTPLWNAYHFFTLYANAGRVSVKSKPASANILDEYILAELNEVVAIAGRALDDYQPDIAINGFVRFLDILNNWYVRLNRQRFWDEDPAAFGVLHFVLTEFCKLLAPFAPFVSEFIFRNLTGGESVHLEKFPVAKNDKTAGILDKMRRVQMVVSRGLQLREKYGLRNRLPLRSFAIAGWADDAFDSIIASELNVKEIRHSDKTDIVANAIFYPLTPRIGARIPGEIPKLLGAMKLYEKDFDKVHNIYKDILQPDEYEKRLEIKPGVAGAALPDNTAVVVIDTEITPELAAEGLANDALRFIQDSRKAAGLDVSDRVKLTISGDAAIADAIRAHEARIASEALATKIIYAPASDFQTEIEGGRLAIKIDKA